MKPVKLVNTEKLRKTYWGKLEQASSDFPEYKFIKPKLSLTLKKYARDHRRMLRNSI